MTKTGEEYVIGVAIGSLAGGKDGAGTWARGDSNMKVTGMCLSENKNREHLVQDFIKKGPFWCELPQKG